MAFSLVLPETYPFSKRKQRKREKESCFAAKSKPEHFFLFQAVIVFFSSNHGAFCIKTRAHAPNGQQHRTPGMPRLVERFLQRSGGYLLRKCTVFTGKKFPCISQGMKKT